MNKRLRSVVVMLATMGWMFSLVTAVSAGNGNGRGGGGGKPTTTTTTTAAPASDTIRLAQVSVNAGYSLMPRPCLGLVVPSDADYFDVLDAAVARGCIASWQPHPEDEDSILHINGVTSTMYAWSYPALFWISTGQIVDDGHVTYTYMSNYYLCSGWPC